MTASFSRRDFLKLTTLGVGVLALRPLRPLKDIFPLAEFPPSERLARNCTGGKIAIHARPSTRSQVVREIYEDTVLPWLREVPAETPDYNRVNQRWVETPEGFICSDFLQLCRNQPNEPLQALPEGQAGFWAEVTVPYVDLYLDNPPARSTWARNYLGRGATPRLYYSQVMWIDQVKVGNSGAIVYRVNERYGNPGDIFWAEGAAFRPLTEEDVAPIHPDVDPNEKKIVVNVTQQTLSCLEGNREVYFCRVSTGAGAAGTPLGEHITWRKAISIHMAGGTVDAGYDTPGISWTTLFVGDGVAIHAAFWHNEFGMKRSHGCVNCKPEDAKWIFRWTTPAVPLEPGDVLAQWPNGGTHVIVQERLW